MAKGGSWSIVRSRAERDHPPQPTFDAPVAGAVDLEQRRAGRHEVTDPVAGHDQTRVFARPPREPLDVDRLDRSGRGAAHDQTGAPGRPPRTRPRDFSVPRARPPFVRSPCAGTRRRARRPRRVSAGAGSYRGRRRTRAARQYERVAGKGKGERSHKERQQRLEHPGAVPQAQQSGRERARGHLQRTRKRVAQLMSHAAGAPRTAGPRPRPNAIGVGVSQNHPDRATDPATALAVHGRARCVSAPVGWSLVAVLRFRRAARGRAVRVGICRRSCGGAAAAVAVLVDAGRLLGQRLFPASIQGQHPRRKPEHECDPGRPPDAAPAVLDDQPIEHHPDQAGEQGGSDEPLTPDELLGRDAAGDVDVAA
jgi:hypothetical protein